MAITAKETEKTSFFMVKASHAGLKSLYLGTEKRLFAGYDLVLYVVNIPMVLRMQIERRSGWVLV